MQAIEWLKLYAQNYGEKLTKITTLLNANFDLYIYINLGFMCYLVEIGLFRKIKISFLMVGHTHEYVDQVFPPSKVLMQKLIRYLLPCIFCFYMSFFFQFRFSHWLNRHAAMTLEKLMNGFETCYTLRLHSIKSNR